MNKNLCIPTAAESTDERTAVMIVLSARNNFDNRNLVRQTYGSIKSANNIRILGVVFMLGNSNENGVDTNEAKKLQAEVEEFGDIVIGDFVDSYKNLTRKTITAYEWISLHCRQAQFIVKTDDDVVVNIFQLTKELNSWSSADVASSSIWCAIHQDEPIITDPASKFFVPPELFPNGTFPDHCAGVGYVTTVSVIDRVADEVSKSFLGDLCTHEDVFMTGIVPNRINSNQAGNSFSQKPLPIKRIDRRVEWVSMALENGQRDEDIFLKGLIKKQPYEIEGQHFIEFRQKFNGKVFYLILITKEFKANFLRLWNIIRKSYS